MSKKSFSLQILNLHTDFRPREESVRAPAISSRKEGDVGSSPSLAKIPFSDEIFLNNSKVHLKK